MRFKEEEGKICVLIRDWQTKTGKVDELEEDRRAFED